MTTTIIIITYLTIGCGAAVAVVTRRVPIAKLSTPVAAVLVVILWPFLLPATLFAEPLEAPASDRVASLAGKVLELLPPHDPQRAVVAAFSDQLRATERRLGELDRAIEDAPRSIRGALDNLRSEARDRLDAGCALLDEIAAQLTLLRFVDDHSRESEERQNVEALLSQLAASATVAQLTA